MSTHHSSVTGPRVAEALDALGRASVTELAVLAGVEPRFLTVAQAAMLADVRCQLAEAVLCDGPDDREGIDPTTVRDVVVDAEHDLPGSAPYAAALAASVCQTVTDALAQECPTCGGTGEASLSAEDDYGRVIDWDVPCYCGGD